MVVFYISMIPPMVMLVLLLAILLTIMPKTLVVLSLLSQHTTLTPFSFMNVLLLIVEVGKQQEL
jgi:hypothetical protein